MPDVIVVGTGVMGAALARYLSRAGASVVDQNEVGGGTSSETFSVDITTRKAPREYFGLSLASAHEHARLAAESGAGATWYHPATVYEWGTRYSTTTSDRPRPEPVRTEGSGSRAAPGGSPARSGWLASEGPAFAQTLNWVDSLLTQQAILQMNAAIQLHHLDPGAAARTFLAANGLKP